MSGSRKPYLLRALVEWAEDNGYTPLITVEVSANDPDLLVPVGYVKDAHITLNIGYQALEQRELGNNFITGFARFSGRSEYLKIPLTHVEALMVRETGEGMVFPEESLDTAQAVDAPAPSEEDDEPPRPPRGRPHLKLVK